MISRIDIGRWAIALFTLLAFAAYPPTPSSGQNDGDALNPPAKPTPAEFDAKQFSALKFRNIGPFRGGRANAIAGVPGKPLTYYMGSTGGGLWQTTDAGITWKNISDGQIDSGSVTG